MSRGLPVDEVLCQVLADSDSTEEYSPCDAAQLCKDTLADLWFVHLVSNDEGVEEAARPRLTIQSGFYHWFDNSTFFTKLWST